MELGLETLSSLVSLVAEEPTVCTQFFSAYFNLILKDLLYVITDYLHVSGFKLQTQILMKLMQVVEMNNVQAPIQDNSVAH